jgi:ubiquinone/menaquinone biosynthesis C-methylase UbiE
MLINMKFSKYFSSVQEMPWYQEFLAPVVEKIPTGSRVLDIGTGSGKLLGMLQQKGSFQLFGVDTSSTMLEEAQKKLKGTKAVLLKTEPGEKLPFPEHTFDYITICNVLFNLEESIAGQLLKEAYRLLKPGGKLIFLTPTGSARYGQLAQYFLRDRSLSILIWYFATRRRAHGWTKDQLVLKYLTTIKGTYQQQQVLTQLGKLEILST